MSAARDRGEMKQMLGIETLTEIAPGLYPRGVQERAAAKYVGMDLYKFRLAVSGHSMPPPVIQNPNVWDRLQLDEYVREDEAGFVYVIAGEGAALVKIGHARNPRRRLRDLQSGSPVPLRIIATTPGSREDEARKHREFAALRAHGEWFRAEGVLRDWIKNLQRSRWEF